jgi:coenzyme F420-reducing hydrogenase alpha subunit
VGSHPEEVKTIIRLHRLGNDWMELLAGRLTHPITLQPGRMTRIPTADQLREFKSRIEKSVPDLKAVAALVASLAPKLPAFDRPTEYVSLVDKYYTFYHGNIGSTDIQETVSPQQYESVVNEYVSPQSTAKWCKWHRESYAVGALARFNLNHKHLLPLAKETAKTLGLKPGACNPYLNSVAQVVEAVQVAEHGIQLIDELLTTGLKDEKVRVQPRAGNGAGAVEAPRGILFHRYEFDDKGRCLSANLCIPTGQNHANIQKDFEALAPQIIDRPQEEIKLLLEMLVRAYDPCISCSTHYLDVEFV